MLGRIKLVGLVAVIVMAISVVATATASAAAEFTPIEVTNGTAHGMGAKFEASDGLSVKCKRVANSMSSLSAVAGGSGPNIGFYLFFTKCTGSVGHAVCTSPGAGQGEIYLEALGSLGYINERKHKVGASFAGYGGQFTRFECVSTEAPTTQYVVAFGNAVGEIKPVNRLTNTFTVKFKQVGGQQAMSLQGELPANPLVAIDLSEYPLGAGEQNAGITVSVKLELERAVTLVA